eukprot:CAMPEP_0206046808 /NCGR_PEP_ID=MMETSP1466-20131121/19598_1 /ASSEMBLY_ACC=CAM_ASM_001126 /TAXON_ID=44452 /ORGANISM="Pavlova gyrans, Strain CCMP608" /LENGTH=203 /DNA_ID=CAMNT_0053421797 /DNA_START=12 /DNA_END=623 /DNA_ORIENTATION=+
MMRLSLLVATALVGNAAAYGPAGVVARPSSRLASSRVSGIEMKKKLKENTVRDVVLIDDLADLGKKGEIVTVKKAYFRNYLLPYGIAEEATPELLAQAEEQRKQREAEELAALKGCQEQAATIESVCGSSAITIMHRAGPDGKLFGTVTSSEVADLVEERTGVKVDKKNVKMPAIGEAGSYIVAMKLHPKVEVTINLVVVGQE